MKEDFPTFGNPVMSKVLVKGSIVGNLPICILTSSKKAKEGFTFFKAVTILPRAALLSILHR